MISKQLSPGAMVGGWVLQRRLGEGGNGVVWQCEDASQRKGALKVLKSYLLDFSKDPAEQVHRNRRKQRFLDEINFLESHGNQTGIIPVLDSFVPKSASTDSRPWFVMPLAVSLQEYLSKNTLPFRGIVEIFRDLANALSKLHADGAYHRDIKPDNILMLDGSPQWADFGLVDFVGKGTNTADSEILGPIFYVAPEMRDNSGQSDPAAADVYSLAKTFWVAASGQKYPLPGEQRLGTPALSLSAYVSDPRAALLDRLTDLSTRHVPSERPKIQTFFEELAAWSQTSSDNLEPLKQLGALARTLDAVTETQQNIWRERRAWQEHGIASRKLAASLFLPLIDALNQLNFTDSEGRSLPTRIIESENNPLWDQWTFPNVLVKERQDTIGSYGVGTITQFMGVHSGALLVCGIRTLLASDGQTRMCAANVLITQDGSDRCEVIWQEHRASPAGSAVAQANLAELANKVIAESPAAVSKLTTFVQSSTVNAQPRAV